MNSGDILVNKTTNQEVSIVMIDEEHNQVIIKGDDFGYRVVNIKGLDIDYILSNGE